MKNNIDQLELLTPSNRLYKFPKPIIGLTGGIATGKSTASKYLKELGYSIIDADQIVKGIYSKKESIQFIESLNPDFVTNTNPEDKDYPKINFPILRSHFFKDSSLKEKIESFLFKQFPKEFLNHAENLKKDTPFVIYDAPLIFEKSLHRKLDFTVLISTTQNIQIKRLIERDQISLEEAKRILDKQLSLKEKEELSDLTILNNDLEEFLLQVKKSFLDIKNKILSLS